MSGGNSSRRRGEGGGSGGGRGAHSGWEEAGGEFYQELYPGAEPELLAAAARLHTLLPSAHARSTTVKRVRSQNERRQSTFARTTQSRDVHLSMLPDLSENLSNEERTWEDIMQIKAMPVPMSQKRELKARLQNATKLRLQGLEQLQWRQRKVWHSFRIRFAELIGKLELWHNSLKVIEGNFGTGVVAYFLFLRWLLFLNLFISLVIVLFLILPKSLLNEKDLFCDSNNPNATECCSQAYFERNLTDNNIILDVLQGTGWMEKTILFYGVYSDQIYEYSLTNLFNENMYYNMPMAYVLVAITWALVSLVAIVKSSARGFKDRLIESEGQFYLYCNLVFGGWDFCIHNEKSANIKHKALLNEIRGCLAEERFKEETQSRSKEGQILLYLRRFFINLVVLAILVASGAVIVYSFNYSLDRLNERTEEAFNAINSFVSDNVTIEKLTSNMYRNDMEPLFGQLQNLVLEFFPFICIVVLNIIVPELFGNLIKFENYSAPRVIVITLLRTVSLRLSSLAVLLYTIYNHVSENERMCSYNNDASIMECWETYAGQQFYKLVITDFAVQFITTFIINMPRAFIARHTSSRCLKLIGEQYFYLPRHVLDIIYTQTIIWLGAFFCPFLPIIGTIFYFLIFYVKKFTCLVNCTPSPTVNRASKSKSMFLSILLISFVVSIAAIAYSIAVFMPSRNCGPFRGNNTVWDYVVQTFLTFPHLLQEFIFWFGKSTFAIPAFAVLLFFLYYYWAVAAANRHMVSVLKNQLVLEGHDKQFLLNRLSAFIRQHQKRCERAKNRASFADGDETSIRQSSK